MSQKIEKEVTVNISEEQTIIELSRMIQPYDSEIYLQKLVDGSSMEINLKSFLGLINLRLTNGDQLTVRVIGEDCEQAMNKVVDFLT